MLLSKSPIRRTSLQDVARHAGVSAAAVSYVVNGRLSEVGLETRKTIEAAIKALKYQPQRRGLSLRLNREFAIGLVIVDPNPNFLSDPFNNQVATGLSNELIEPGYGLTVTGCRTFADLDKLLRRPIGVDAFVVIASGTRAMRARVYRQVADSNRPFAVVQDVVSKTINDSCSITQDDFDGARALTLHLSARGAKRILFAAPACIWPAIEQREQGIRKALPMGAMLSKIECNEHDFGETAEAIDRVLQQDPLPDAIMGANDQIAIAALRVLDRRGIKVPGDMLVTGYNDFVFRNYVTPRLTTVASRASDIGHVAAKLLLQRLDTGAFDQRKVQLAVALDLGGTTADPDRLSAV